MLKACCVMYFIAGLFASAAAYSSFELGKSWEIWAIVALLDFVSSGLYYKRIKEEQ